MTSACDLTPSSRIYSEGEVRNDFFFPAEQKNLCIFAAFFLALKKKNCEKERGTERKAFSPLLIVLSSVAIGSLAHSYQLAPLAEKKSDWPAFNVADVHRLSNHLRRSLLFRRDFCESFLTGTFSWIL